MVDTKPRVSGGSSHRISPTGSGAVETAATVATSLHSFTDEAPPPPPSTTTTTRLAPIPRRRHTATSTTATAAASVSPPQASANHDLPTMSGDGLLLQGGISDDEAGSSSTPAKSGNGREVIVVREKAKRGARACVSCRRLKKTCEGGAAPCVRCRQSGTECVFDKPASSVVEDAGLTRLAGIEAALATNERRMDAMVQQMGEISNVLTDVLQKIKQAVGSQSGMSPGVMPHPVQLSPHPPAPVHLDSNGSTAHVPTPPTYPSLHRPRPHTAAGSPGFASLPQYVATSHAYSTSPLASTSAAAAAPYRRTSLPGLPPNLAASGHRSSALDALAHLASSASPDVHRFATHIGQPIQALQDAVEQLNDGETSADDGAADGGHESAAEETGPDGPAHDAEESTSQLPLSASVASGVASDPTAPRSSSRDEPERPAKRARVARPSQMKPDQFDLVAKGLIDDKEARALVLLWMKECQPFCSVLDANYDTYESLRKRSAFLFNAVVFTALRARERCAPPSKELLAASEETSRFARDQVFETKPTLEVIQAMMVMACYHQEPYILSGVALRLALVAKLDTTIDQIDAHGWTKTDELAQRLTAQLRTWMYIVTINGQHERNLGRMTLMRREDVDALISQADRALQLPFAISSDFRHVANLRLYSIVRSIMIETASFARNPRPAFGDLISYVYEKKQVLQDWHAHYDALISSWQPSMMSWPRRSHNRQYHDAQLGLITNTFKQQLLDPPATAAYEVTQIVQEALDHARSALQMVLGSQVYRSGTQWSGYLLRTDMGFAGIFLLKCAAAFPHLVDRDELVQEVLQTAELLSTVAGSQKYALMLRAAANQFLEKTAPPPASTPRNAPNGTHIPSESNHTQAMTPTSSSLRDILSNTDLQPPPLQASSFSLPPNLPPGPPQQAPDVYSYAFPPPDGGMTALMPGEMEIDWSAAVQPTLFDDSILSQHDWAASVGLAGGWQNWT